MHYRNTETGERVTERQLWERYREALDETLDPFLMGDISYAPSTVLERVDPIAFRVGFNDWADAEEWEED